MSPSPSPSVVLSRLASSSSFVSILTVNGGYIPLALNWLCWARRAGLGHFLFLAEDQKSARFFRQLDVPVIVMDNSVEEKKAVDYGSVEFQQTMSFRTEFLQSVLNAGFHFLTADLDAVWFDQPLNYLLESVDLQGQMHKDVKISGGLVAVRSSVYGKFFWNKVRECQRENAQYLASHAPGTYEPSKYTEQYCINELSLELMLRQPLFSRHLLDPYLFPDGRSFFEWHQSQMRGIMPVVIHNNWITGLTAKVQRMKDWNLWIVDETDMSCQQPKVNLHMEREMDITAENEKASEDSQRINGSELKLVIRIAVGIDHQALSKLLLSLESAEYPSDALIDIHFLRAGEENSVNKETANEEKDDLATPQAETEKVIERFKWPESRGKVEVHRGKACRCGLKVWPGFPASSHKEQLLDDLANPFRLNSNELLLYLHEDIELSAFYYRWIRGALSAYYPATEDAQLAGFSLLHLQPILGETEQQRFHFESRTVETALRKGNWQKEEQLFVETIAAPPMLSVEQFEKQLREETIEASDKEEDQENGGEQSNSPPSLFRYQLPSFPAFLFFPRHFNSWIDWLVRRKSSLFFESSSHLLSPCVPTLISNKLWQEHVRSRSPLPYTPDSSLSAVRLPLAAIFLIRFVFEYGLYFLQPHFADLTDLAAFSNKDWRAQSVSLAFERKDSREEEALHSKLDEADKELLGEKAQQDSKLPADKSIPMMSRVLLSKVDVGVHLVFPLLESTRVPIYNFHFRSFLPSQRSLLLSASSFSPASAIDQCWTLDRLAANIQESKEQLIAFLEYRKRQIEERERSAAQRMEEHKQRFAPIRTIRKDKDMVDDDTETEAIHKLEDDGVEGTNLTEFD